MSDVKTRLLAEIRCNYHPDDASGQCVDADIAREAVIEIERFEEENKQLRAEIAHLKLYQPAQSAQTNVEPVKQIGETNFSYFGVDVSG